jgi:hypothetical protein
MLQADLLHSDVPQEMIARGWQKIADDSMMRLPGDEYQRGIVSRVIEVPPDDPFVITETVQGCWKHPRKQVYSSHAFIGTLLLEELVGCRFEEKGHISAVFRKRARLHMAEKVRACESKRAQQCHADGLLGAMLAENVMHMRNLAVPESTRSAACGSTSEQGSRQKPQPNTRGRNTKTATLQEIFLFIVSH